MASFAVQKLFNLNKSHLLIFGFVLLATGIKSTKLLSRPMTSSLNLCFFIVFFMISGHTFKSLIHFKLISVYGSSEYYSKWNNFDKDKFHIISLMVHIDIHTDIHTYVYIYMCVCVDTHTHIHTQTQKWTNNTKNQNHKFNNRLVVTRGEGGWGKSEMEKRGWNIWWQMKLGLWWWVC